MATSVSDDFNRANGDVGGNWTDVMTGAPGRPTITSNQVGSGVSGTEKAATYTGASLDTANYDVTITYNAGTACVLNIMARFTGTGATRSGYLGQVNILAGTASIIRVDNGSETVKTSGSHTASASNVYKFRVNGQSLTLYANGAVLMTSSDTTYSSTGAPGLGFYNNTSADDLYDNFSAAIVTSSGLLSRMVQE